MRLDALSVARATRTQSRCSGFDVDYLASIRPSLTFTGVAHFDRVELPLRAPSGARSGVPVDRGRWVSQHRLGHGAFVVGLRVLRGLCLGGPCFHAGWRAPHVNAPAARQARSRPERIPEQVVEVVSSTSGPSSERGRPRSVARQDTHDVRHVLWMRVPRPCRPLHFIRGSGPYSTPTMRPGRPVGVTVSPGSATRIRRLRVATPLWPGRAGAQSMRALTRPRPGAPVADDLVDVQVFRASANPRDVRDRVGAPTS